MAQLVGDRRLVRHDGSKVKGSEALADKVVVFYFSGFCLSCYGFTTKLKGFYERLKEAGKPFEVVQVPCDGVAVKFTIENPDLEEKCGKWLAVEVGDPQIQEYIEKMKLWTVITVYKSHMDFEHAVRVVKADGTVVSDYAMAEVEKEGVKDPVALFEKWQKLCK